MREDTKSFLSCLCFFLLLALMIVTFIVYENYSSVNKRCEKFDNYGYVTELEGPFFVGWVCYIIMEDGTKIDSHDFNIADYKKPMEKSQGIILK